MINVNRIIVFALAHSLYPKVAGGVDLILESMWTLLLLCFLGPHGYEPSDKGGQVNER